MNAISYTCPACEQLITFQPWSDNNPSLEICPHCGIQFGYDDALPEIRSTIYKLWNKKWHNNGNKFLSNDEIDDIHNTLKK